MKYLLDTDVLSQYKKGIPDPRVDSWLQRTDDCDLFICDITFAELWYGASRLPVGKKRAGLEDWIENELPEQFFNQVAYFGRDWTRTYGRLVARRKERLHCWRA